MTRKTRHDSWVRIPLQSPDDVGWTESAITHRQGIQRGWGQPPVPPSASSPTTALPPRGLLLKLIKFNLPPLHKSTAFLNSTNYLLEYAPTLTAFDPAAIPVPPHAVVKDLDHDKDICSIVLVHLLQHCDEDQ
ncbi:hypothetical protein B0H14DRAFT_2603867 [Mycena olivaceomarginata]|nr:hypothetical protein B0H14DRAFT_2603867 [Mycena olivaceomarginata]